MMRGKLVFTLLLGSLLGLPGLRADNDTNRKDAELLKGRWKLESIEAEGKATELGENSPRWVIKGSKVFYGGDELAELAINSGATPKTIDLAWTKPKRAYEGIYVIDGDTLKICVNRETEGVKERPQELMTEGKSNLRLLVFKRDKAENPDVLDGVGGFVGIMIRNDAERKEIVITGTLDDSPAKKAGLQKDDVVISAGGAEANDLQTVVGLVRRQKPGQELAFKIKRDGKEKEITIKVGKMPFFYLD